MKAARAILAAITFAALTGCEGYRVTGTVMYQHGEDIFQASVTAEETGKRVVPSK